MADDLKTLRKKIRDTDDRLLRLIHRRNELAKKVGKYKLANDIPIKNFQVEKEVLAASRAVAKKIGLYEDMAADVARLLIHYSVQAQEEFRNRKLKKRSKQKKQILIVGGLGKMGQWLAQFFESFGHQIAIFDRPDSLPAGLERPIFVDDLAAAAKHVDVVILSAPISKTADLIETLVQSETKALVFDICSLKSPILEAIADAEKAGLRITSVHPMFGPDVKVLSGRNIILCKTSDETLCDETEDLFKDTAAKLVRVPLKLHDEMMSYVLGLSHMVNLAFAKSLSESHFDFSELRDVASSTFFSQIEVASAVVAENQNLYYEIQAENHHSPAIIKTMIGELTKYHEAIENQDRDLFREYMEKSRNYIHKV